MYTQFHIIGSVYSNELPKEMTKSEAKRYISSFTGLKNVTNKTVEIY